MNEELRRELNVMREMLQETRTLLLLREGATLEDFPDLADLAAASLRDVGGDVRRLWYRKANRFETRTTTSRNVMLGGVYAPGFLFPDPYNTTIANRRDRVRSVSSWSSAKSTSLAEAPVHEPAQVADAQGHDSER
jgi:hypothetical protein